MAILNNEDANNLINNHVEVVSVLEQHSDVMESDPKKTVNFVREYQTFQQKVLARQESERSLIEQKAHTLRQRLSGLYMAEKQYVSTVSSEDAVNNVINRIDHYRFGSN